jgi:aryl-alcohol dehydrogenase-like predicted oxidoreductase
MRYRFLGGTGLAVSELCLGAMGFGRESDEALSVRMLDHFAEVGGTFVDTSDAYNGGLSEEIVGRWLKGRDRQSVVVSTKVRWGPGGNREGLGRKHIRTAVEASLRRLGTDHIDLYHVHGWDPATGVEEVVRTLDNLVTSGKVRYLAVSNWSVRHVQQALDLAGRHGREPFVAIQALYNLLDREAEWELLPLAGEQRLGFLPWSPLRGGWLSGKYHRGVREPLPGTRIAEAGQQENWQERWQNYDNEHTWTVLDALHAAARESGRSPAQVALNWLLRQPHVTAPVIGARTMAQLEANLGATGWDLDPALTASLTAAGERRLPYPYEILAISGRSAGA